jgi:hypothetical protein
MMALPVIGLLVHAGFGGVDHSSEGSSRKTLRVPSSHCFVSASK